MIRNRELEATCCGAGCVYADSAYGPCWGDVEVVDDADDDGDFAWIHACRGHAPVYDGDPYVPDPGTTGVDSDPDT